MSLLRARLSEYGERLLQLNEALRAAQTATPTQEEGGPIAASAIDSIGCASKREVATETATARLCAELAIQADEAGNEQEEAIKLYTQAAESYLKALRLMPETSPDKAAYRSTLAGLLDRAEQLKNISHRAMGQGLASSPAAASIAPGKAPEEAPAPVVAQARGGGQLLTAEEKEVLARSSRIGKCTYYPWLADGQREQFHYSLPWEDPDGLLPLSAEQRAHFGRREPSH